MLKVSTFLSQNEIGYTAIPLFGPADSVFEKTASASFLPPVLAYIENLRPTNDAQYVLVNAMGAWEYFGSNINGDGFPEAALIHSPKNWTGNPMVDKIHAKSWPYGYPTFYNSHPYAHHRNKDPSRAYGEVELVVWNDHMKRVELVIRVDHDKCVKFGGVPVWDRLKQGQFPDVSMGAKVPFDTSSITLDWELYREAQATFDPKKHKHPGQAVLEFHKKLKTKNGKGIPGVSVTRHDYDDWCKKKMNHILPDGRKVFVYNDYPRFFDISFVFIGADKTAKVMVFVVRNGQTFSVPSTKVAHDMGYRELEEGELLKCASAEDRFVQALVKGAENKKAEIEKDVVPSQLAAKAVPVMTRGEPDIPEEVLDLLGKTGLSKALSTTSGLGMVLKPKEFQRITLVSIGMKPLADTLDEKKVLFPKVDEKDDSIEIEKDDFVPSLAKLLLPLLSMRTALAPMIERRVLVVGGKKSSSEDSPTSHSSKLLRKIGAAYGSYRDQLMDAVTRSQDVLSTSHDEELQKVASADAEEVFTPLSYSYLKDAYWDEVSSVEERSVIEPSLS